MTLFWCGNAGCDVIWLGDTVFNKCITFLLIVLIIARRVIEPLMQMKSEFTPWNLDLSPERGALGKGEGDPRL